MTQASTSSRSDWRAIITEALHAYELVLAGRLRDEALARAEQARAAELVAAMDAAESATRMLLERAGQAHIAGAPASPDGIAAPMRRPDAEVAGAFAAAQMARVEVRGALLRLACTFADAGAWDDARRTAQALLDDGRAPLYFDALDLCCLTHYVPAETALQAGTWEAARRGFEAVLKLNESYRDAAALLRESYLRPAHHALEAREWEAVRRHVGLWLKANHDDIEAHDLQCESYYRPALADLEANKWSSAQAALVEVLKLNTNYRDTLSLLRESYLRQARMTLKTGEALPGNLYWLSGRIKCMGILHSSDAVLSIAFSPDGLTLASVSRSSLMLWNPMTQEETLCISAPMDGSSRMHLMKIDRFDGSRISGRCKPVAYNFHYIFQYAIESKKINIISNPVGDPSSVKEVRISEHLVISHTNAYKDRKEYLKISADNGIELVRIKQFDTITDMAFSSTTAMLATAIQDDIWLWQPEVTPES